MSKISGPLLDRIDIHITVPAVKYQELNEPGLEECSSDIKQRVEAARSIQRDRLKGEGIFYNAAMSRGTVKKFCLLSDDARGLLKMAMAELGLSARGYTKILKVSRTIADLKNTPLIRPEHIAEAIQYRSFNGARG